MERINSCAIGGGAYGDEGKGKITDERADEYSKKHPLIVYRVNGGANAGHTIEFDGTRISLHQLPSGAFADGATIVLGKGMVLHPGDLLEEIKQVKDASNNKIKSSIKIDSMATLALDTHRAFESVYKKLLEGSDGSTGRGISPAYADILLRHPLRMRDLSEKKYDKFAVHYDYYNNIIKGLDNNLEIIKVKRLGKEDVEVGSKDEFINRLKAVGEHLEPFTQDVYNYVRDTWSSEKIAFIFEMAQAVGLDSRYGAYPDITASDTTFASITASTEGIVDWQKIQHRISVIKATYMSSVGSRKLPTKMPIDLAHKIREDANEYGATTKRPRDIAYIDLPALRFFSQVSGANEIAMTHMDVVYPNTPVKVCNEYRINEELVNYRPDQRWLDQVVPNYIELPTWDRNLVTRAKDYDNIPSEAKDYIDFMKDKLNLPVTIITAGPKREQTIQISKQIL